MALPEHLPLVVGGLPWGGTSAVTCASARGGGMRSQVKADSPPVDIVCLNEDQENTNSRRIRLFTNVGSSKTYCWLHSTT